ncbi:MAG TPA: NAD(P)-binding domain-containing protein [Kofleriaceae bacterium]|nr:NAD(P)-binding domain-containing protein [Kofleriaceae bacterium]
MTWVVPLALGGLAILVMVTFTMLSARRRHHATVAPAQVVGPRILVHDINDDRCTGCDACVAVCPTNVLDLVANKSRVLRFEDCIQCEACMFACPTEALVMFPEGAVPPPLKVPEMDENFQTAVPGQYLIGEVAGKPLVKNAANLGRAVIEHMLTTGLYPGALGQMENTVDVAIVGSGPGGLSAALSCIQKGLSYVVLEKEQEIASTIARYPKGKLVMAEPYDTSNVSFLPVFDSSKEQLIPIWKELIERVRLRVNQGESVESVQKLQDGTFEIRSTVAAYRAQRVVLSIGTRGKPRTLQVPGENLPKIFSLLEDPDMWAGRNVLVVGGGDSAVEAALALSDAGARVIISYRGKGFNRAQPKNKSTIERYAGEGRIKAKLGSQVLQFDPEGVTMSLGDGQQKRYPNDAAFVLIGADPPVAWLEKMGIRFVERPHQYQLGKSDDIVRRFVARVADCPEDAARAAAAILGGSTGIEPSRAAAAISLPMPGAEAPARGPKKWLRSATSIFSTRTHSQMTPLPKAPASASATNAATGMAGAAGGKGKRLDAPMPLSEFAKRSKRVDHTGHGRRDQLTAGERTRILRMLRDEGGRLADEESQVHIGAAPPVPKDYDFDFDDEGAAPPPAPAPSSLRPDVPAKPALVVGLAQARNKRQTGGPVRNKPVSVAPPVAEPMRSKPPSVAPSGEMRSKPASVAPPMRSKAPSVAPPPIPGARTPRRTAPPPMSSSPYHEKARNLQDNDLVNAVRSAPGPGRSTFDDGSTSPRKPAHGGGASVFDEPTRMGDIDAHLLESTKRDSQQGAPQGSESYPPKFLDPATEIDPMFSRTGFQAGFGGADDEATRMANVDLLAKQQKRAPIPAPRTPQGARKQPPPPGVSSKRSPPPVVGDADSTRAVDIRKEPNRGSDDGVDWDID